jgi:hypothetical protein
VVDELTVEPTTTATTQVKFLNYAMAYFDSTAVVPTFFVMFTVAAIMVNHLPKLSLSSHTRTHTHTHTQYTHSLTPVLYQVGAIFFEDFSGVSQEKEGIFSAGIILCFFGVYLITSQRPKEDIDLAVRYGDNHYASFASVHRSATCLRGRITCDRK